MNNAALGLFYELSHALPSHLATDNRRRTPPSAKSTRTTNPRLVGFCSVNAASQARSPSGFCRGFPGRSHFHSSAASGALTGIMSGPQQFPFAVGQIAMSAGDARRVVARRGRNLTFQAENTPPKIPQAITAASPQGSPSRLAFG